MMKLYFLLLIVKYPHFVTKIIALSKTKYKLRKSDLYDRKKLATQEVSKSIRNLRKSSYYKTSKILSNENV